MKELVWLLYENFLQANIFNYLHSTQKGFYHNTLWKSGALFYWFYVNNWTGHTNTLRAAAQVNHYCLTDMGEAMLEKN